MTPRTTVARGRTWRSAGSINDRARGGDARPLSRGLATVPQSMDSSHQTPFRPSSVPWRGASLRTISSLQPPSSSGGRCTGVPCRRIACEVVGRADEQPKRKTRAEERCDPANRCEATRAVIQCRPSVSLLDRQAALRAVEVGQRRPPAVDPSRGGPFEASVMRRAVPSVPRGPRTRAFERGDRDASYAPRKCGGRNIGGHGRDSAAWGGRCRHASRRRGATGPAGSLSTRR